MMADLIKQGLARPLGEMVKRPASVISRSPDRLLWWCGRRPGRTGARAVATEQRMRCLRQILSL